MLESELHDHKWTEWESVYSQGSLIFIVYACKNCNHFKVKHL